MKLALVGFLFLCILHIHFRGKVRLPFMRQLFDHSSFMAPINLFMHTFSRVPSKPYLELDYWKELAPLQQNWEVIREEARNLIAMQKIKAAEQNNDAGFNSFFKTGWKRFYLKWYDAGHPSAERLCRCCARFRPSRRPCLPNCRPAPSSTRTATRTPARCATTWA